MIKKGEHGDWSINRSVMIAPGIIEEFFDNGVRMYITDKPAIYIADLYDKTFKTKRMIPHPVGFKGNPVGIKKQNVL